MQGETAVRHNGIVVAVRGSVVDMRFDGELPAIHSLLRAGDGSGVAIEVLAQRDARYVRGAEALTDADRKQVARCRPPGPCNLAGRAGVEPGLARDSAARTEHRT